MRADDLLRAITTSRASFAYRKSAPSDPETNRSHSPDQANTASTTVLIENVTHHMEEEEQEWFPKVREGLGRKQLQDLGARMLELRKKAPTEPSQPSALKKVVDAVLA